MNLKLILITVATVFATGESLKCYYCAENIDFVKLLRGEPNVSFLQEIAECDIHLEKKFNKTCADECGKLIIDIAGLLEFGHEQTVIRGCAQESATMSLRSKKGHILVKEIACDTDFCNGSLSIGTSSIAIILGVVLFFL